MRYDGGVLAVLLFLYALTLGWVAWRRRPLLRDALVPGLLGMLTLAFFWRLVVGDAYMPADGGDLASFLYPTYVFIQRSLQAGVWPLWNPHLYSGTPFVAEVQSGIFYPPHLLRFLLGPDLLYPDMQWLSMLHIWWAGVTTYLLVRGLGLWRIPALLAAVAFMFSDLFIVHFGNLNLIAVVSWLPLALLGVHRCLEGGGIRPAVGAGLALGIAALAGHVQMTLYSLMVVALWVGLWVALARAEGRARWRRAATALLIPTLIAVGMAAPLLLPGMQMSGMIARSGWRYADTVGYSLSPAQLIGLIIPGYFGRSPQFHWGPWPRVEVGYIGVFTLILTLIAVMMRRTRTTWLLLGMAAISLAFSLGIYSILHGWITWLTPGLEQLRAPARFIFVLDLALAILAAYGLQALLEPWDDADKAAFEQVWRFLRTLLLLALAIGVPVVYAVLLLTQNADPALHLRASVATQAVIQFLIFFSASLALLLARRQGWIGSNVLGPLVVGLLFIDLATMGAYNDVATADPTVGFQRQGIVDFLRADPDRFRIDARTGIDELWQPDAAQMHGLEDVWGVANPLTLSHYTAYWDATGSRSTDLYALLNVKYLLGRKDVPLDWDVWELAYDGDPDLNVYRNRRFQPRVHLLGRARPVPDLITAQAAIRDPDFQPLLEVVLEGGEPQDGSGGSAQVAAMGMNDMVVATASSDPGALLIAQTWYPGWEASIDGGPWQPVLRADGALQAVQIPAGSHEVRLRFRSRPLTLGLIAAAVTLLVAIALLLFSGSHRTLRSFARPSGP